MVPVAFPMTVSNSLVPEFWLVTGIVTVTVADLPGNTLFAEVKEVADVKMSLPLRTSVTMPKVGAILVAVMSPLLVTTIVIT